MTITDPNLADLLRRLPASDRAIVTAHMVGKKTPESWALIRQLRRRLKRKVRTRVRKLVWLG